MITEAGNDPRVKGLVYITAFAPDKGESVSALLGNPAAQGAPKPPILPPQDGFLMLDMPKFPEAFAADVKPETASISKPEVVARLIEQAAAGPIPAAR